MPALFYSYHQLGMIPAPTFWTARLVFAGVDAGKDDLEAIKLLYADPKTQAYGSGMVPA